MTIGQAIKTALDRQGVSQVALAERLGVDQGTVSRWCGDNARYNPRPRQLQAIEDALGLRHGWLLIAAGFVDDVVSARDAIEADSELDDQGRRFLLLAYDDAVARRRGEDGGGHA